jgi:hypothetical protein
MHSLIIHSCISYRPDYSRWRRLHADRGPSRGKFLQIPEPEGGCSEDPKDFVREFSEGPNQSSDVINLTNPSPTSKGKPRT